MEMKRIAIQGLFDEEDWHNLLVFLRQVERKHPEVNYVAAHLDETDLSNSESLEFLLKHFPSDGKPLEVTFKERK